MREHDASETPAPAAGEAPLAREKPQELKALASKVGNAAFGRLLLARSPLSDAIQAAPTAGWPSAFTPLAGLNASQTRSRIRALDTADMVTLRQHIGDAPAGDQARITTALGEFLKWTDAEATAIQALYATGSYSTTDTADTIQTHEYALWRGKAVKKLHGKPAAEQTAGNAWLAAHEAHETWRVRGSAAGSEPAAPGPLPAAFSSLGNPPSPSMRIVHQYAITLPGTTTAITYRDDPVAPAYQYLTNETGVGRGGQKVSNRSDIAAIFTAAGIADTTVRKVMTKVSTLEGGFEAVNTYDTGYISVGFIQFISGADGAGSLAKVLRRMRTANAAEFTTYFHSMGVDVDSVALTVVDPATGTILRGSAAVHKVMDDKRLTAVFQRAGLSSQAFQAAQLKQAESDYYLASQSFSAHQGAVTISGTISDVLTSEAGKVAIMDRAVQKGAGGGKNAFVKACKEAIAAHGITTLAQLATYEREIVAKLINRMNVFAQTDLTQPPALPAAAPAAAAVPSP